MEKRSLFRLVIPRVPYPNIFSHIVMPPLGAIYVASSIKENSDWDVEVIDELNWKRTLPNRVLLNDPVADHRRLQSDRPATAVGFYAGLSSTVPRIFDLVKFYKSLGIRIVAGGAHVDALPEEALREGIHIIVHGEGEETILSILKWYEGELEARNIPGISFLDENGEFVSTTRREPNCRLDNLPVPDFNLLTELKRPIKIAPFERTRGCNYNCEFCIVSDRFGHSRSRSPEVVAAEIERRIDEGYRSFFCVDDNFTQGKKETIRFLELVTEIRRRKNVKLDFTTQVRSSVGRDNDLMRGMKSAGVHILCIGLESPIHEELEEMSKHQTPEQIEQDVRSLRNFGFMIHGMFIFGYPLQNWSSVSKLTIRERADKYIAFVKRSAIDTIQVLKPVPIPGSRLADRLGGQGRIFPLNKVGWDKYDGSYLTFMPDGGISASEIQKQANRIMRSFYSPLSFLKFPLLVFATPVEILRLGFRNAREFARDPAAMARAALSGGAEKVSAFRAGFAEAGHEIFRKWRSANLRTFGSIVYSSAMKEGRHSDFVRKLREWQESIKPKSEETTGA